MLARYKNGCLQKIKRNDWARNNGSFAGKHIVPTGDA